MSMAENNVSELLPTTGQLFFTQVIYEHGEPFLNIVDRRKPKNSEKNLSQFHFAHHKSHMD
jgi:hypothetical protein